MSVLRYLLAIAVAVSSLVAATPNPASAHEVTPMRLYLSPGSGQRSGVFAVRNTRDKDLPLEVVVLRRFTAADGSESMEPADDDFIIFPPQALVTPGASQSVRFEYIGEPNLTESRVYVLDVREVPVTPPGFSGILTVYNFGVAVYVRPVGASADLDVGTATRDGDLLTFEVRNLGNDFAVLSRRVVTLEYADERVVLQGTDFAGRVENPVVPPNAVRQFRINAEGLPAGAPVNIRIADSE